MNFVLFGSCVSLVTSRDRVKGTKKSGGGLFGARLLSSSLSPVRAMFDDPIEQSLFKTDVFAGFFAFDPLVLENLFPLGQELLVEHRILHELRLIFLCRYGGHVPTLFHKIWNESIKSSHRNLT